MGKRPPTSGGAFPRCNSFLFCFSDKLCSDLNMRFSAHLIDNVLPSYYVLVFKLYIYIYIIGIVSSFTFRQNFLMLHWT